ncbi:hypothetical protein PIB30_025810 [Stylosanthes scabra]|uniref:Uncharacterized protein n=1 Tax=Stylosanthes scabra TaxID=79078 RepID=A0ABU6T9W5_9FABA|nr:hypothetical protein [Stylosanthes scabra]
MSSITSLSLILVIYFQNNYKKLVNGNVPFGLNYFICLWMKEKVLWQWHIVHYPIERLFNFLVCNKFSNQARKKKCTQAAFIGIISKQEKAQQ